MSTIRTPHIFVVLFVAILLAAAATWLVPAGSYDRAPGPGGRKIIVADSYHRVDAKPAYVMDILSAVPRGLENSAAVIFGVLLVGGAFGVINATRTIDLALHTVTVKFKGRETIMIPIIMILFAAIASFIGTPELSLVYIPIIVSLCLAIGWDSMAAAGITLIGVTAGFSTALINPFSVGIAQQIAGLPGGSGMGFRIVSCLVLLLTGIVYTFMYVRKITRHPAASLTAEEDKSLVLEHQEIPGRAEARHVLTGLILLGGIAILVRGIVTSGWYMTQLAAVFMAVTILVGLVNRMPLNDIAESFTTGCKSVLVGALVVGFARGVALILENALIMDTIINALSSLVLNLPAGITAAGMVVTQTLINFLVPSSSGQAVIAMPIMASLADLTGVNHQVAVLAFQFGDGMSNIMFPTSGYFMATIAMAGVSYQKWLRFFTPLFILWILAACLLVIGAQMAGWS